MNKPSEHINQIVWLSEDEKLKIDNAFNLVKYSKKDFWIQEGKICRKVAYVQSGTLRLFYIDELGNENTCYFIQSDNFVAAFTSFLTNTPTHENITFIEDSVLFEIAKENLEKLSDEVPKMHIFRRVVAENLYISMEKRIAMMQSKTAKERYEKMLEENPDILLNVPLQYTASFLGITPQHLSRLRKNSLK